MPQHVCIVGAGISGLRCANVLLENGFDVTMVEARDRLGGRIMQSDAMGSLKIDIGANWVHSTGYNPIVELAKITETPLHLWNENTLMIDMNGNLVDGQLANEALKRVWQILERASDHSTEQSARILPTESLYDYFVYDCNRMVEANEITNYEADLILGMAHMWGAYVGDQVEKQSLKFFFLEDCIEGDDCFIASNYIKIMDRIAEIPRKLAKFQFETVMHSVEAMSDGRVRLKTTDGREQEFDYVVITAPLGWLKKHKDSVQPLHPRISTAIDSISFGRLEKVLIEFPFPFWEQTNQATNSESSNNISFAHWLSPAYAPETNPNRWRLECVSFNAFPKPYQRSILLFYTFGDCSTYTTASIQGLEGEARFNWLQKFFQPYYSRLPNYDPHRCTPVRILATEWCNDEFSGNGSYCNFQIGLTDAAAEVEAIRHGMPDEHIYFAGEHTAPFDGLGTVAGAYNSGDKVGQRIAAAAATTTAAATHSVPTTDS